MSLDPPTAGSATAGVLPARHRSTIAHVALYLGALSVLATGVVHIQQYYDND